MSIRDLITKAYGDFQAFLVRPAATTREGILKALAFLAQAKPRKAYPPRKIVGVMTPKRGPSAPIFYIAPPGIRLNRSRKWPEAATYADARRQAVLS